MYFFRKKDSNRPTNFNIRAMHWVNKFVIIVFILGVLWKLIDIFILSK
ncbi:DUF6728 family protein [Pedobacter arcticus]|nr:DUF6728 family protein [Pedobacter arcticus]